MYRQERDDLVGGEGFQAPGMAKISDLAVRSSRKCVRDQYHLLSAILQGLINDREIEV